MKTIKWIAIIILFFILCIPACFFVRSCNTVDNMAKDGLKTVEAQYSPSVLLKKYEWFKDASAQCENKLATLGSYEARFKSLKESYGSDSLKRRSWSRSDTEQWNVWESEYLGIKASYNDLSAQYNAAMAKFNYRFCNTGVMPDGSTNPLPREFKSYINN